MKRLSILAVAAILSLAIVPSVSGKSLPSPFRLASSPAITLSPNQGKPGETFTVAGSNFACHGGRAVVIVTFDGTSLNGSGSDISCNGTFSVSARVPDTTVGAHTVTASGYSSSAPATSTPPAPTATAPPPTATAPPPVPTNTFPAPTSVPTVVPPTSTAVPPTATSVPTSTATPTGRKADITPGPFVTPTATMTPPPTSVYPTPTPLPTIIVTPCPPSSEGCNTCPPSECGGGSPSTASFSMMGSASVTHAGSFDGDRATATFTVTAPTAPFAVSQSSSCPTVVAGQLTTCTITESVSNNGPHTLDFSHTVVNHLAQGVQATSASASVGSVSISGNSVVWNNFELAPGKSASASITVSFTPSASSAGGIQVLSDGLSADAVDVVTGEHFGVSYGSLRAQVRARTSQPRSAGHGGAGVTGLPSTGGAADRWGATRPRT